MAETQRPILTNVTRLHHYMDHAGCAAVVVRSGKNFTYLAGFAYPGTLARHLDFPDSPREVLLLWPRHSVKPLSPSSIHVPWRIAILALSPPEPLRKTRSAVAGECDV